MGGSTTWSVGLKHENADRAGRMGSQGFASAGSILIYLEHEDPGLCEAQRRKELQLPASCALEVRS